MDPLIAFLAIVGAAAIARSVWTLTHWGVNRVWPEPEPEGDWCWPVNPDTEEAA